jgi:hypothetical protein
MPGFEAKRKTKAIVSLLAVVAGGGTRVQTNKVLR